MTPSRRLMLLVAVLGKADEDDAVGLGGHGKMGRCFNASRYGCRWIMLVIYRANVLDAWEACQALVFYRYEAECVRGGGRV